MIYVLPAIGLTPGGSSAVHIYTQNRTLYYSYTFIHRTQWNRIPRTEHT